MNFVIVGLGNPGEEYNLTRHNSGRMAVSVFAREHNFPEFVYDKKANALVSKRKLSKTPTSLVLPETFMNKSGTAVRIFVASPKKAANLVIVHDDLDLPLGKIKISFNKSSGGHRGVESVMRNIKTEAFVRLRIGISPAGSKGQVKKPQGEEKVNEFIIGKFKPAELVLFKKDLKKISKALKTVVVEGKEKAMSDYNTVNNVMHQNTGS